MKGRNGMELSVGMVVMLIISIVMFIGALALVQNFFKEAIGIQAQLSKGIDDEIHKQLRQGTILTIPVNKVKIKRGKDVIFGLGIRNVLNKKKNFCTYTFFDSAYQPNEKPIGSAYGTKDYDSPENKDNYLDKWWVGGLAMLDEPGVLENNEFKSVAIRLKANNNMAEGVSTASGTYVFNVCVYVGPKDMCQGASVAGGTKGEGVTSGLVGPEEICRFCAKNPGMCADRHKNSQAEYVYTDKVLKVYVEVQ